MQKKRRDSDANLCFAVPSWDQGRGASTRLTCPARSHVLRGRLSPNMPSSRVSCVVYILLLQQLTKSQSTTQNSSRARMMALLTLLSPWLSPAAAWFIFFNAVVGAIAIMSSTSGGGAGATSSPRCRLCRSGSSSMGLDRLRSFFVFPVGQLPVDESSAASGSHFCSREAEAAAAAAAATQVRAPAERNPQAVVDATTGESEKAAIRAAQPSAPVAVATPEEEEVEDKAEAEEEKGRDESISLDEAYALAQRHRGKPLKSPPTPAAASATTAPAALSTPEHKKKPTEVVVADWRMVPKAGEAQLEGKAELNARAELFIRQFREDLRLQRLNSILKHTHALGSPTAAR